MFEWLLQGILTLFGLSDWLGQRRAQAEGVQQQRDADLKAENAILKKREAVPHPTGNPFDDGKF